MFWAGLALADVSLAAACTAAVPLACMLGGMLSMAQQAEGQWMEELFVFDGCLMRRSFASWQQQRRRHLSCTCALPAPLLHTRAAPPTS